MGTEYNVDSKHLKYLSGRHPKTKGTDRSDCDDKVKSYERGT